MRPSILVRLLPVMLLACVPHPAAAGLGPLPGQVFAGEVVDLRWSDLPPDVDEVELELSLDCGRWTRISPERHAAEGVYRWRVSRTASDMARVRLRVGGEGFERVLEPSAPFRIVIEHAPRACPTPPESDWAAGGPPRDSRLQPRAPRILLPERQPRSVAPETPTLSAPRSVRAARAMVAAARPCPSAATRVPDDAPFRVLRN
jgi:hypothetical protein